MSSKTDRAPSRAPDPPPPKEDLRFPPEEEATLLEESHTQKLQANKLFSSARYSEAIQQYERALSTCPTYLEYEIAVLRSNISACHIKLEDWKSAIESATASLEALDRLESKDNNNEAEVHNEVEEEEEEVEDIISPGASRIGGGAMVSNNNERRKKEEEDRARIRIKALMRRAKARTETGGWSALAGAEEDYKSLSTMMTNLPAQDRKIVNQQLRALPAGIEAAKQKEMGEMMGKLKELGNGILKPFGLSTENFKMVKDEKSGGYSVQFNQGGNNS